MKGRRTPPPDDLFGWAPEGKPPDRAFSVERARLVDLPLRRVPARDTDLAWCVQKSAASPLVWLPRSAAELDGEVFTFPHWMAVEKGLL